MNTLDLSVVPDILRDEAMKAFVAGNAINFLGLVENTQHVELIEPNLDQLCGKPWFSELLVTAWVGTRTNQLSNYNFWELAFDMADHNGLRKASDPIPDAPLTLYRGVSGEPNWMKKVIGYSWTSDYERALWFANRYGLPNPEVYQLTLADYSAILFHTNDRNENEFVLSPDDIDSPEVKLVWESSC